MKSFIISTFILISLSASAEPLEYYKLFFRKKMNITHDPDYAQYEDQIASSFLYDTISSGQNTSIGVLLLIALEEDGTYSMISMKMDQRIKDAKRSVKFSKCRDRKGKWKHSNGLLYLDNEIELRAFYKSGENKLKAKFLDLTPYKGLEGFEPEIIYNSLDSSFTPEVDKMKNLICPKWMPPIWIPLPDFDLP